MVICHRAFLPSMVLTTHVKPNVEDLVQADMAFSALSREKGMKHAFLTCAADSAVLLQRNAMPVVGEKTIVAAFKAFLDTGFTLNWKPMDARLSKSGELGYT